MPRQNISSLVSGMGIAMGLVTSLVSEVQKRGGTDENIYRLVTPGGEDVLGKIAELIVGSGKRPFSAQFSRDMTKEGWTLVENVEGLGEVAIADLELVSFVREGEPSVSGEEMRKRAKELNANLGQFAAEYLLEHQNEIPVEWRSSYLVFPRTVWRRRDGFLFVPYLFWSGGRWSLLFSWLEDRWLSGARLVRPRK